MKEKVAASAWEMPLDGTSFRRIRRYFLRCPKGKSVITRTIQPNWSGKRHEPEALLMSDRHSAPNGFSGRSTDSKVSPSEPATRRNFLLPPFNCIYGSGDSPGDASW